ncbi:S-layer homology domain-containing protein [Argonema galeatum]|uniref:S-layer homology domain-containing protein n=1 Tax=Argonema galeatum TaxID=2942762 RepID=UPI003084108B
MSKNRLPSILLLFPAIIISPLAAVALPTTATPSTAPNYGCISGYSNGTYQGNRPLTRYEFAAAMNACLNQIDRQLENNPADRATKEDLVELTDRINRDRQELQNLSDRLADWGAGGEKSVSPIITRNKRFLIKKPAEQHNLKTRYFL